jgi:hypothetical protein
MGPNRGAAVKRGEQVISIKADSGCAYLAKDGKPLGYVEEEKLRSLPIKLHHARRFCQNADIMLIMHQLNPK